MAEITDRYPETAYAARVEGRSSAPFALATESGHVGWLHETPDGLIWFIPDAVARSIHGAGHGCDGWCPATLERTDWSMNTEVKP